MRRAHRVGLIGARRARQGLGPFVAKWLALHGAEVVAHAGTSAPTVAAATADLERIAGVRPQGHVGVAALLEREDLDAVAILSPPEHHGAALEACLAAGVHVLCEKPLLPPDAPDAVARVRAFEAGFAASGRALWENCQWPRTLPAYRALFPAVGEVPRTFSMGLEPASHGAAMLSDALSHPLSLLQALLGDDLVLSGVTARVSGTAPRGAGDRCDLAFVATGSRGTADARVELRHAPSQPRRAWYALDGRHAERIVEVTDYSMRLAGEGREVGLEDPLERHLAAFLAALDLPAQPARGALSARMAALAALYRAGSREPRA